MAESKNFDKSGFETFAGLFSSTGKGKKIHPFMTKESLFLVDSEKTALPNHRNKGVPLPGDLRLQLCDSDDTDTDSLGSAGQLECFCVDHMKLCSTRDAVQQHRGCKEVISSLRTSGRTSGRTSARTSGRTSVEDKRLGGGSSEEGLKKLYDFAGVLIHDRESFKQTLKARKEECYDTALDLIEDLVAHAMKKKKDLCTHFDKSHAHVVTSIDKQIKRCYMLQRDSDRILRYLKKFDDYEISAKANDEYRRAIQEMYQKCVTFEAILFKDYSASKWLDYEFHHDPRTLKVMELESIGDVVVEDEPSKLLKFMPTVSSEATADSPAPGDTFVRRDLVSISKLQGRDLVDKTVCCFTGCAYLQRGKIVMSDWNNCCLKLFDKHGVMIDKMDTPKCPWDVCQVSENEAAVTLPAEKSVCIVQCDNTIEVVASFQTNCECWGIASICGHLALTCDPWSNNPTIRIYSLQGVLLRRFHTNSFGENLFKCPLHLSADLFQRSLLVTDSSANTLVAMTLEGELRFTYQHQDLDYPTGVTTDRLDNIYVCGKDSANVHQVRNDGKLLQIMNGGDGLTSPRALCFAPDGEHVVITDISSSSCNGFLTKLL